MILLEKIRDEFSNFQRTISHGARKLRRQVDAAPPILIFQMGRVGSVSIRDSLSPIWPGLTVHTHNVRRDIKRDKKGLSFIYNKVIRRGRPLFVISPVREPIAHMVSTFFKGFERYTGVEYSKSRFSIEELTRIFLEKTEHGRPLAWYDGYFKPTLGIDVYDHEFSSSGIQIIHHKNTRVLLLRSELLDCVKESAVRDFLGLTAFSLSNRNVSSQKPYAETYSKFIDEFVAPDWYIQRMYETRFFNHFYGEAFKNRLIEKWTQRQRSTKRNITLVGADTG
jgi:Putative capsular polysaccharide synthesis protein